MGDRRALGRAGEDAAARFYRARGFTVVDRNYRAGRIEIDLVARRGRLVVVCEVKTRRDDRFGAPAEAVDAMKAARIRRAAGGWLAARRPGRVRVRFDVVSVIVRDARMEVDHIPDAF